MIKLNPFAISGLLIAITYLPLFILITLKGNNKVSRIYSFHILSIFLWGIGSFLIAINENFTIAFFFWAFAYSAVIFIPIFFYHAILILFQKENLFVLIFLYLQGLYFLYLTLTGKMFDSMNFLFNSFYYHSGSTEYLLSFIIWLIIVSVAHLQLIFYYKKSYPDQKRQILTLILSSIGFAGGILNFLPGFNIKIYPYGNFIIIIPSFIITYAILKHQLLDISIVFKRSIAYSLLIFIISSFYLLIIILSEKFLQNITGYNSIYLTVIIAFGLGIIFFPLRNRLEHWIEKIFFKKSRDEFAEENELLQQELAQTEKLKAVATLASGMSHEIKNPLTAIKTFTEYLPEKKDDKEFLDKFAKIVGKEVDRIDDIVHQLLEFAKPSPLAFKQASIHKLLDETLDFLNSKLIKNKIKILREYTGENAVSYVDPNRLKQAFLNILLNAIDAMPIGGILTIETSNTSHLPTGRQASLFTIHISDTGPGISKKDLKNIFDPFYTKKDNGTGLGLSITQRIVLEHNGRIWVESVPGQGAKFVIEMPIEKGLKE